MNYEEAIAYILGRAGQGKKVGLENMRRLLCRLGNPQNSFKSLHIAGTNGKGSVCAFTMSALMTAGYKVGMYTSPYLMRYNERIQINGEPIPDETLARVTQTVAEQVRQMEETGEGVCTIFETGTAIAFAYFCEEKVDYAVIEVGLGGRLDPTNVILPKACAIARIGMDHTKILGDTLEKIAWEKAGIVKEGVPVAVQAQEESICAVIRGVCAERNAQCLELNDFKAQNVHLYKNGARFYAPVPGLAGEYEIALCGSHQVQNAITALGLLSLIREEAGLNCDDVRRGLSRARWPGRLEWFGDLLLDGAHNPQGARSLAAYLSAFFPGQKAVLLTGVMADKAVSEIADVLAPYCRRAVCVRPEGIARAMDPEKLAALYADRGVQAEAADSTAEGLRRARELAGRGLVLVCGSLYLAGEVRLALIEEQKQ